MPGSSQIRDGGVPGDGGRLMRMLMIGAMLFGTSACAAVSGNQRPVTARDLATNAYVCPSQQQILGLDPHRTAAEAAGAYRDRIVMECIKAINAHYLEFRVNLHKDAVSANLVTDIVSLGLTTGASVASGATAKRLAAGGAFVLGAGAAINKDVFYQQTLPAIEAIMDANRDKILKRIVDAEKADPSGKNYQLTNAGIDLDAYQGAGDIYTAINSLNRTAAAEAETAKQDLAISQQKTVDAGLVVQFDQVAPRFYAAVGTIKKLDGTVPANLARLRTIATALKVPVAADASADDLKFYIVAAIDRLVETPDADKQAAQIAMIEALLK